VDTDRLVQVGYAAAAAVAVGSLGPWAVSGPVTSSGVDSEYGLYAFLLGLFAGFVLWRWSEYPKREFMIGLGILAGICLIIAAYFAFIPEPLLDLPGVDPGWGLVVTIAGSAGLVTVAGLLYRANPS
jgi:hypothetical protein